MGIFRKLELTLDGVRYVFGRADSERLLAAMAAWGDDCSDPCRRLREALGWSLNATEEQRAERKAKIDAACGISREADATAPHCWLCGRKGEPLPVEPGDSEGLYVCRTEGCARKGKPAARLYFETGRR